MRLSREELLKQYPIWNESKHNIVKIMYGDEPLVHYDKNEYLKYHNFWSKDKTCANIMAVEAYIYSQLMINIVPYLVKYILMKMIIFYVAIYL